MGYLDPPGKMKEASSSLGRRPDPSWVAKIVFLRNQRIIKTKLVIFIYFHGRFVFFQLFKTGKDKFPVEGFCLQRLGDSNTC